MRRGVARYVRTAGAAASIIALASVNASAQSVQFMGNVSGCFFTTATTPTSCGVSGTTSSVGSLTYTGSIFNASSNRADGLFTLGSAPMTGPGGTNANNLGSFNLHDGNFNYTGQKFALFMNFTQPSGASGNNQYTALVTGDLSNQTNGNVFINFTNTPRNFTFEDGSTLSFGVNSVSANDQTLLAGGTTVAVTGQGYATVAHMSTVPEPSSIALVGTGLIGIVPLARRRKNAR